MVFRETTRNICLNMSSSSENHANKASISETITQKPKSEAAQRALAEAEERRKKADDTQRPKEINGRGGLDPVRYNDWEVKGLTSDF
jgi:hypothetical protein